MKVFQWLNATNPNQKGISRVERVRRATIRSEVYATAGTTPQTIAGAKTRNAIGRSLIERLANATQNHPSLKNTDLVIRWEDEVTEKAEAA